MKSRDKLRKLLALAGEVDVQENSGRPRKEEKFPDLLSIIWELACQNEVGADPRRRSESVQCPKTLDDLTKMLNDKGNYYLYCCLIVLKRQPLIRNIELSNNLISKLNCSGQFEVDLIILN